MWSSDGDSRWLAKTASPCAQNSGFQLRDGLHGLVWRRQAKASAPQYTPVSWSSTPLVARRVPHRRPDQEQAAVADVEGVALVDPSARAGGKQGEGLGLAIEDSRLHTTMAPGHVVIEGGEVAGVVGIVMGEDDPANIGGVDDAEDVVQPL